MTTLRCSSLPLLMKCSAPIGAASDLIDVSEHFDMSDMGSAAHEACQRFIEYGEQPDVLALLARHGLENSEQNVSELDFLIRVGINGWEHHFAVHFPEPRCEMKLSKTVAIVEGTEYTLAGHPDVVSVYSDRGSLTHARVLDFKFGRVHRDWSQQMIGYAWLVAMVYDCSTVTVTVYHARTGNYDSTVFRRKQLNAWRDSVLRMVLRRDEYAPGADHCHYCPKAHGCEARQALVRSAAAELTVEGEEAFESITPERMMDLYIKSGLVKQAADRFRDAVKERLLREGSLEASGRVLSLEEQTRDTLDPELTLLEAAKRGIEPGSYCTIRKGDLMDQVRATAKPGEMKHTAEEFLETLKELGGVTQTVSHRFNLTVAPTEAEVTTPKKRTKKKVRKDKK